MYNIFTLSDPWPSLKNPLIRQAKPIVHNYIVFYYFKNTEFIYKRCLKTQYLHKLLIIQTNFGYTSDKNL